MSELELTPEDKAACLVLKRALLAWQNARRELDREQRAATSGGTSSVLVRSAQERDSAATVEANSARQALYASLLSLP